MQYQIAALKLLQRKKGKLMPVSAVEGKKWVMQWANLIAKSRNVQRVLDLGCGQGTYYALMKNVFPNAVFTAVEIWGPYIEKYSLDKMYKTIYLSDIRHLDYTSIGRFDVAFAGDVFEHITTEEAICVADKVLNIVDLLFVSIPICYMPQGVWEGNPYERHIRDNYTYEEILSVFPHIISSNRDGIIGTFLMTKNFYAAAYYDLLLKSASAH